MGNPIPESLTSLFNMADGVLRLLKSEHPEHREQAAALIDASGLCGELEAAHDGHGSSLGWWLIRYSLL